MTTNRTTDLRTQISRGVVLAALLLGASLATKRLSPQYVNPELAHRLLGVLMGMVVVIYANTVPKTLTPLLQTRCDPIAAQAARRFTGWSLVVGGAAYALAWAFAPLRIADMLAAGFLGASLLLVAARVAWTIRRSKRPV